MSLKMGKLAKPRLSKNILEMKFMQRTKAKVDKELEEAEGRAMYSSEITEKMINEGSSNFIYEPSFTYCEGLIEGRLSFRGMNPEIERLLELEQAEREAAQRPEQWKEVSDMEMAAYFAQKESSATKVMERKFQTKRKLDNNTNKRNYSERGNENDVGGYGKRRRQKKGKFQRPRDDDY